MTKVQDLETPVATIDLDRLEKNIKRGQEMVAAQGLGNRPHIKTHKIPDIARMQIEAGASGITCQKLSEAEVFIDAGVADDVLITFDIVGEKKTEHLMRLSDKVKRLAVVADNEDVVRGLSAGRRPPRPRRADPDRERRRLRPERRAELRRRPCRSPATP